MGTRAVKQARDEKERPETGVVASNSCAFFTVSRGNAAVTKEAKWRENTCTTTATLEWPRRPF